MKHARSLALLLVALAVPLFPKTAGAEAEVSFEYFQEALSPLGEWIEVGDYGLCWRPTGVGEDWAPYTDGYWSYTDAGWTWVSYEDWGGITYHYGRWIHLVDDGWVWVPEYDWGPAWVSWRSNDDYVGWAPLPPEARWVESTGFSTWVDTSYDIGPDSYRFCHTRDFGAPVLAPVCVPYTENVVIIQNTFNCTNITFNRHASVVFCGGPNLRFINEHSHRPIPSLKLLCEDREVRGPHGNRQPQIVRGNQIALYAPRVKRPGDLKALPITPRRVVGADKINRGWSRVPDLAAQQQIKERLQKQTAGLNPRTAPARPVRPADLSTVPVKAIPNAPSSNGIVRDRNAPPRAVVVNPPATPAQNPPVVGERVRPQRERPILQPQPFQNDTPKPQTASRPPQVAVPDESSRTAEIERVRVQREQPQQQENARRAAIARQQQEDAQRSNELRNREAQQQQRENEQRIAAERSQRVQEQRQRSQADTANAQQQEAHRQQLLQQRQQAVAQQQQENANRAAAMRQQQEAAQRSNEIRSQPSQQAEVAQRRQEAVQRSNEMRQQPPQARQAEAPRRQEVVQPSRPAPPPPPSQPSRSQSRDSDDDKKKGHSGR